MKTTHILTALSILVLSAPALAVDSIVKPYVGSRSAGMGGVHLTTGLYDQNFYGNPARVTANPKWKLQMPDVMLESTIGTIGNLPTVLSGTANGSLLQSISATSGQNMHGRVQFHLPSLYLPMGKMSFAAGIIGAAQFDLSLRRSFQVENRVIADIGPNFSVGRTFLPNDELSVGINARYVYRLSSVKQNITVAELLQGTSLGISSLAGDGARVDFDLGATYRLPWKVAEFEFTTGAVFSNLLGGESGLPPRIVSASTNAAPLRQSRSMGFGVSASRKDIWKAFSDLVVALEVQNIGNAGGGSIFRLLHLGAEIQALNRFAIRLGVNQGYLTAGLGIDIWAAQLDLATYGEEMSLNTGRLEDRRFLVRFGFQI